MVPVTQTVSRHFSELGGLWDCGLGFFWGSRQACVALHALTVTPPVLYWGPAEQTSQASAGLWEPSGSGEGWCFTTLSGEHSKGQASEMARSLSFVFWAGPGPVKEQFQTS